MFSKTTQCVELNGDKLAEAKKDVKKVSMEVKTSLK